MVKIVCVLFLLLTLVGTTVAYKILCLLPYPGKSHHMVFEPLLQELAERGHNLTVVSFFPSPKPHRNRRDVSLVGLAPIKVEVLDLIDSDYTFFGLEKYFESLPIILDLAKSNLQLCKKLLDSNIFDEFVKAKGDYDLIMVEHFNSDCMMGLIHNYGLPSVGLMSCAILPWTPYRVGAPDNPSYVPGMTQALTDKMTFLERVENTFFLYFYIIWYELAIRREEQVILEKKLGRKLPVLEDIAKNTSVVLVNTHHSLNGVRVLPPSVVEVGGIHLQNRSVEPLPQDLQRWMAEAKNGVILFSFGSLIRGSSLPDKKMRAILKVFARLPQRVVWKWEANNEIEGLPDNVLVSKWLPQYDLLHHPNCVAFITHAGVLSLTEAVSAGIPVVAVPILGDQFGNAAHARSAGIAEVLRFTDINEDSLLEALKKVLSKTMQDRAKILSKIWKDRPLSPMDTAVYYIEKTARFKGLDISSHGRWLSRYQLALLDLVAFVLVGILVALGIMLGLLMCLCRRGKKLKQS